MGFALHLLSFWMSVAKLPAPPLLPQLGITLVHQVCLAMRLENGSASKCNVCFSSAVQTFSGKNCRLSLAAAAMYLEKVLPLACFCFAKCFFTLVC